MGGSWTGYWSREGIDGRLERQPRRIPAARTRGIDALFPTLKPAVASPPARQQVNRPTAADVLAAAPAVRQDHGVGAAGVFQRVGEDGQVGEAPPVVDGRRQ